MKTLIYIIKKILLGGIGNIDAASKVEWKGTKRRSAEKISLKCVTEEDEEKANKVRLNRALLESTDFIIS